jgi:hypothetical protein
MVQRNAVSFFSKKLLMGKVFDPLPVTLAPTQRVETASDRFNLSKNKNKTRFSSKIAKVPLIVRYSQKKTSFKTSSRVEMFP